MQQNRFTRSSDRQPKQSRLERSQRPAMPNHVEEDANQSEYDQPDGEPRESRQEKKKQMTPVGTNEGPGSGDETKNIARS